MRCERERQAGILLNKQQADVLLLVDPMQNAENLLHDQRRETKRGLVQQQQLGPQHERTSDGEHLLLATG